MPLYEYECKACGNRFEKIQKFSDPLVTLCPKCGQESVEQMISAPAFQFKGSGWYVNDYAAKKSGNSAAGTEGAGSNPGTAANSDGAKSDNSAGKNTDTKSESKDSSESGSSSESKRSSESTRSSESKSSAHPSSSTTSSSEEK